MSITKKAVMATLGCAVAMLSASVHAVDLPGGDNVLFMDGHVEFGRYPQPAGSMLWPVSELAFDPLQTQTDFP